MLGDLPGLQFERTSARVARDLAGVILAAGYGAGAGVSVRVAVGVSVGEGVGLSVGVGDGLGEEVTVTVGVSCSRAQFTAARVCPRRSKYSTRISCGPADKLTVKL